MPGADQQIRVGREEEGTNSNRPELAGVVLALRQAELTDDVLILCDNESVLKVIKKWIGQGGKPHLLTHRMLTSYAKFWSYYG